MPLLRRHELHIVSFDWTLYNDKYWVILACVDAVYFVIDLYAIFNAVQTQCLDDLCLYYVTM